MKIDDGHPIFYVDFTRIFSSFFVLLLIFGLINSCKSFLSFIFYFKLYSNYYCLFEDRLVNISFFNSIWYFVTRIFNFILVAVTYYSFLFFVVYFIICSNEFWIQQKNTFIFKKIIKPNWRKKEIKNYLSSLFIKLFVVNFFKFLARMTFSIVFLSNFVSVAKTNP